MDCWATRLRFGTAILVLALLGFGSAQVSFGSGDRIEITYAPVRVRAAAGFDAAVLGTQALGARGTILPAAPVALDGQTWWRIDFDTDPDGWVMAGNDERVFLTLAAATGVTRLGTRLGAPAGTPRALGTRAPLAPEQAEAQVQQAENTLRESIRNDFLQRHDTRLANVDILNTFGPEGREYIRRLFADPAAFAGDVLVISAVAESLVDDTTGLFRYDPTAANNGRTPSFPSRFVITGLPAGRALPPGNAFYLARVVGVRGDGGQAGMPLLQYIDALPCPERNCANLYPLR